MKIPILLLVTAVAVAGCGPAAPRAAAGPAIRLAATLDSPTDVTLRWSGVDPRAAGCVVEFTSDPAEPFVVLRFLPPGETRLRHPDLIPQTVFSYRVRPYSGPVSNTVEVALPPGDLDEDAHRDDPAWAAPRVASGPAVATAPVRDPAAAPTGLRAAVADANGIVFTWTDHAAGEEGFLLEAAAPPAGAFHVVAVLDPDVVRFGLVTLPTEKRAAYRVRAYYHGDPSATVTVHTGG